MNPAKLPDCPIRVRKELLAHGISETASAAAEYYEKHFAAKSVIDDCLIFHGLDLADAVKSDFRSLRRIGFFPSNQVAFESARVLDLLTYGLYRHAYDSLRRALELAVVGSYFLQESVSEKKGREWINSDRNTPMFSRALERIVKHDPGRMLDQTLSWGERVQSFYWRLCDIVHVKGERLGYVEFDQARFYTPSYILTAYSEQRFEEGLHDYIEMTRQVACIVAVSNPVVLIGLPVFEKYGFNSPLSGFFSDKQSSRLRRLLHPSERERLLDWVSTADDVQAVRMHFESMPDLTDDELVAQSEEFDRFISELNNKASRSSS